MRATRYIFMILCFVSFLLFGYWLGHRAVKVTETVRIDSVFYEKPLPTKVSRSLARVSIPVVLYAPADTIQQTVLVSVGPDSARLQLAIERKEYRDSTYHAVVSGPAVGNYGPRLERIETYNRTITRTVTVRDPYRWEIGPAVGGYYSREGGGIWLGGQVRRSFGRLNLTASGGWKIHGGGFVQLSTGITLWRQ